VPVRRDGRLESRLFRISEQSGAAILEVHIHLKHKTMQRLKQNCIHTCELTTYKTSFHLLIDYKETVYLRISRTETRRIQLNIGV
jgi:hypothetical protein